MKIDEEFVVGRGRSDVVRSLDRDDTFAALFPDTTVHSLGAHERETHTPYPGPGRARDIRFVFRTREDGNVRFEKICDGNIWRSLEGEVRAEVVDERMTRIVLSMEGRTRAFGAFRGSRRSRFRLGTGARRHHRRLGGRRNHVDSRPASHAGPGRDRCFPQDRCTAQGEIEHAERPSDGSHLSGTSFAGSAS